MLATSQRHAASVDGARIAVVAVGRDDLADRTGGSRNVGLLAVAREAHVAGAKTTGRARVGAA